MCDNLLMSLLLVYGLSCATCLAVYGFVFLVVFFPNLNVLKSILPKGVPALILSGFIGTCLFLITYLILETSQYDLHV